MTDFDPANAILGDSLFPAYTITYPAGYDFSYDPGMAHMLEIANDPGVSLEGFNDPYPGLTQIVDSLPTSPNWEPYSYPLDFNVGPADTSPYLDGC